MENSNQYGVYVIFSEQSVDQSTMMETLKTVTSSVNPGTDIPILRKCLDKDVEDTKRWHVCMRKELIEVAREKGKELGLNFYVYRANQHPIGNGRTYAFYIPYTNQDQKQSILSVFDTLEGKFLRPDSYSIHYPTPRNDGTDRGYMLVSFAKNGDFFPRPFIRTLRALINDLDIDGMRTDVKWCSHSVLRDVTSRATK
jgi:hypothetical protein